ncbi:MAG: hypothetical protein FWB93_00025 [Oscillospiraceae bacterium]|nr:hypothetical protein [Oscillospiraceae bacterium]
MTKKRKFYLSFVLSLALVMLLGTLAVGARQTQTERIFTLGNNATYEAHASVSSSNLTVARVRIDANRGASITRIDFPVTAYMQNGNTRRTANMNYTAFFNTNIQGWHFREVNRNRAYMISAAGATNQFQVFEINMRNPNGVVFCPRFNGHRSAQLERAHTVRVWR